MRARLRSLTLDDVDNGQLVSRAVLAGRAPRSVRRSPCSHPRRSHFRECSGLSAPSPLPDIRTTRMKSIRGQAAPTTAPTIRTAVARQRIAWIASGDRTERLRHLDVPTLVIHSVANRVCDVSGGRATAEAVPGAELVLIGEMGHNLPLTRFAVPTRSAHRRVRVAGGGPLSTSSRDSWRYARVYKDVTIAIAHKSS